MTGSLNVGRTLDRYQIERPLGQGGMATVVQVRHTVLGTVHAMKVLHLSTPRLVDRFLREGRVQASIRHPNLVAVTDVVSLDSGVALILEYVDGPTLSDLLKLFSPTMAEIDTLADQVMQGVASANAKGVVHRDLKPANILIAQVPDGLMAKVTDFGLAHALIDGLESPSPLTLSGVAMGTPGYMAPEQHRSARNVDQRADVFSLGALFYELVTGRPPFDGQDIVTIYEQIIAGRYLPIETARPDVPMRIAVAIHAALTPDPAGRPADVAALRELWHEGEPGPYGNWEADHLQAVAQWIKGRTTRLALPPTCTETLPQVDPSAIPLPTTFPSELETAPETSEWSFAPPSEEKRPFALGFALAAAALGMIVAGSALSTRPVPASPPSDLQPGLVSAEADPSLSLFAVGGLNAQSGQTQAPAAAATDPSPESAPAEAKRPRRSGPAILKVKGTDNAILIGADNVHHAPGEPVPPGEYRLWIQNGAGEYKQVLQRTLQPGERATVVCTPDIPSCR